MEKLSHLFYFCISPTWLGVLNLGDKVCCPSRSEHTIMLFREFVTPQTPQTRTYVLHTLKMYFCFMKYSIMQHLKDEFCDFSCALNVDEFLRYTSFKCIGSCRCCTCFSSVVSPLNAFLTALCCSTSTFL